MVISKGIKYAVPAVGGGLSMFELFHIKGVSDFQTLSLLILLVWICEHYYIATDFYKASMVLPILFFILYGWGLPIAILIFGLVSLLDWVLFGKRRVNGRFYTFSFVIALITAAHFTDWTMSLTHRFETHQFDIWFESFSFTFWFSFIKFALNLGLVVSERMSVKKVIVPQTLWSLIIFVCSFLYSALTLTVDHQNFTFGIIHHLFYFFFFMPIVTTSLIASFISRIEKERARLTNVFALTSLVNRGITAQDPIQEVVAEMRDLMSIDASTLWLNENGKWEIFHRYGLIKTNLDITEDFKTYFLELNDVVKANREEAEFDLFHNKIQTFIYAPLRVEGDLIGVWAVGSTFKNAYGKGDFQSFVTLANHVAAVAKTRRLVRQQESHKIVEERNRIAREIHDGIAQTIAGAVMDLESIDKSFYTEPERSHTLVKSSVSHLRASLSQVRASIYALRPNPTEQLGLVEAIRNYTQNYEEENPDLHIRFVVKGKEQSLGVFIEKGILDIFREGLRNIEKHAQATKITIFIGYFENAFCLFLKDNGKGFSLGTTLMRAWTSRNFGMLNMNELAEQLGAVLNIQSREGWGTKISLTVPYQTDREEEKLG